ncbi:DUF6922 domain-containing protein [Maribellus mangrovi]|uniref:DUF6922 domain-containing protein n=1 Tax=Maribellus mangrovi TaxID=3133146 RepID=UPI0030EC34F3
MRELESMFFSYDKNKTYSIRKTLLWEYDLSKFNWQQMQNLVVQRVVERGRIEDFQFILSKYGLNEVKHSIRKIPNLHKKDITFVCTVFNLKKEELRCCSTIQFPTTH